MPPVNAMNGRQFRYAGLPTAARARAVRPASSAVARTTALGRDFALLLGAHRRKAAFRASTFRIRHFVFLRRSSAANRDRDQPSKRLLATAVQRLDRR
jgi:hypothetical protein